MNESRQAIFKSFANPDPASVGVYKMINDVYPAFAEKLFENNSFMQKIVMTGLNPMHILDYPICGKCETLAMPDKPIFKNNRWNNACGCFAKGCGAKTINPITLREWLIYELKKKAPKSYIENIEFVVDSIAKAMINNFEKSTRDIRIKQQIEDSKRMGLIDSYGNPLVQAEDFSGQKRNEVTLTESDVPIDLEQEGKKIGREENADVRQVEE